MPGREPSLGELADDIHAMQGALDRLIERLDITYVRRDVYELAHRHLEDRVDSADRERAEMKGQVTWALRAAVTGFLLPLLVTVAALAIMGAR